MRERAPAFQFYPRQFAGDDRVMSMDLETIGAHILLMCAAAASPERCRIDADEYAIRMRLRNPSDEAWTRIKKQLLGGAWKVSPDGKWWVQSGLQRTFQKQNDFSESQRARAAARWKKEHAESMPDVCRNDAETMPDSVPNVCSSSSSSNPSSELRGSDKELASGQRKSKGSSSPECWRLAALLKTEILRNKPDYKVTAVQERNWSVTADRMLRLDGRDPEEIADIIRWSQADEFWMSNILSMDKLREKFDQLQLKRGVSKKPNDEMLLSHSEIVRRQQAGEEWRQ